MPTLEQVKDAFDNRIQEVLDAIPNVFNFAEGIEGNFIADGGGDMFDNGNFLSTSLADDFDYSNDLIQDTTIFGENSRYYTKKYPGALFMLAADNT